MSCWTTSRVVAPSARGPAPARMVPSAVSRPGPRSIGPPAAAGPGPVCVTPSDTSGGATGAGMRLPAALPGVCGWYWNAGCGASGFGLNHWMPPNGAPPGSVGSGFPKSNDLSEPGTTSAGGTRMPSPWSSGSSRAVRSAIYATGAGAGPAPEAREIPHQAIQGRQHQLVFLHDRVQEGTGEARLRLDRAAGPCERRQALLPDLEPLPERRLRHLESERLDHLIDLRLHDRIRLLRAHPRRDHRLDRGRARFHPRRI